MLSRLIVIILSVPALLVGILAEESNSTYVLDPLSITASRILPASDTEKHTLMVNGLDPEAFGENLPSGNDISHTISRYAGYSAFRRTASSSAHPTTQGIRLRHIGANATSRALMLLDGVPQNDPFGGWVYWHRYHEDMLESISINPSGGGEAWGNLGAGGVISLQSSQPYEPRYRATAQAGSRNTYSFAFSTSQNIGQNAMADIGAKVYSTDGFNPVLPNQQGPVDMMANSEAKAIRGRVRWMAESDWNFSLSVDAFEEERSNGTALALNDTDATDISFQAIRDLNNSGSHFSFSAYRQDRDFANVFTAVDENRQSERPALNQFDVPAEAGGASISYFKTIDSNGFLLAGADYRVTKGEVRELFRNLGAGFTRERKAGGEQAFAGLFATLRRAASEKDSISATIRLDRVEQTDGLRQEKNLETGAMIRSDEMLATSENELSIAATWYHNINDESQFRLKGFSGFRSPTLNELYRPFRVRNDITESNPELKSERFNGLEASWARNPSESQSYFVSIFHYEIEDLIANAFLSNETGFNQLCGFVPEGGSCSQRRNLDESRVTGFEARMRRDFSEELSGQVTYLFTESEIVSADSLLTIDGKDLPHAPSHRLSAWLAWSPTESINIWTSLSLGTEEYEDTRNTRRIDGYETVDAGIRISLSDNHFLSLRIENLLDEDVTTGVATSGLETIGAPRGAWLTWNYVK